MAGDWIKVEVTTPDKPEVHAMADELGLDPDAVIGKLLRIWSWFDQHSIDGNDVSVSESLLDRIANKPGFTLALANAGWILPMNGKFTLPKFDRHNGETAKTRALTAKRVAKFKCQSNAKGNAEVTPATLPREEKRREELKTTTSVAGAPPESDQVIQTLPLLTGGEFEVRQSFVAELEPLYPKVDVPATVREMKGWLLGNPDRRKTSKGIKRFITNWLQAEQQKAEAH